MSGLCPNCGNILPPEATFCPCCGQKDAPSRVPAREILGEFFSTLLAWDSRLWRTLKRAVQPGRLTIAYFQGQRASLIPPARLFLFAVLIHLAVINFFLSPQLLKSNDDQRIGQEMVDIERSIGFARASQADLTDTTITSSAVDSLIARWEERLASLEAKRTIQLQLPLISEQPLSLSVLEMETGHPDSLCVKHGITSMRGRLIMHQLIKAYRHPRNFGNFIVARLSWMIFLLVPLMGLILYLIHFRGPYYYIEHLVFTMHVHVAAFLLVSVGLMLDAWTGLTLSIWFLLASLIYTLLAMKRYYSQGWLKTFFKFALYHIAYVWIGLGTGVLLLIAGFLLFSA